MDAVPYQLIKPDLNYDLSKTLNHYYLTTDQFRLGWFLLFILKRICLNYLECETNNAFQNLTKTTNNVEFHGKRCLNVLVNSF